MTSSTADLPDDLAESLAATIQHIALLRDREAHLATIRDNAQEQLLHRIGSAHRCGEINDAQLYAAFEAFKAAETPRRMHAWDAHVAIPWKRMIHIWRHLPEGPDGTWVGAWPISAGTTPRDGTSVVYVLFAPDNEPCYVGSTSHLRPRLAQHDKGGKQFTHWQAHPCRDREHAYELELRLLKERKPYLNRKVGR